jgi:predicted hydrocarbon binding protein
LTDGEVAMGTWGSGVFANDDAMDWIAGLEETDDIGVVEGALDAVVNADGYIEAPTCAEALAAAEVVATMRKEPGSDVPSEVFECIARVGREMSPELPGEAQRAIDRILADSELQELWEEAGGESLEEWRSTLTELRGRLE